MTATELLPPDEMTLDAAAGAITARLECRSRRVRRAERTFYDTFDGLLHRAGLSLIGERDELWLVQRETGEVQAQLAIADPAGPLFAGDLQPGALREALEPVAGVRAITPLVRIRSRERPIDVLGDERKTVVRMSLDESVLVGSARSLAPLRPRVRLSAIRGYDKALARVCRTLEDELGFKAVDQPLVDEAVRAGGGVPGGLSAKLDVPLQLEQRSDSAAGAVLSRLLEVIEANLPGTLADVDSEFLHDLRVAVRRSRSVQRELARVFPPEALASFRAEFRWLQQITGEARDLDVYVLEFGRYRAMVPEEIRGDLEPLLEVLRERRLAARAQMTLQLRSARAERIRTGWASLLSALEGLPQTDRPGAARPIGSLAGERIRKVYRRMVRMGEAISASSPAADYHELRKKGKELRYLLELFGAPMFPGEVVKPMVRSLKALQDVLGRHQDREIQVALLHSLCEEVAARQNGTAAVLAMGALVQRLHEDQLSARGAFAERFAQFASKPQRKLVKTTFA